MTSLSIQTRNGTVKAALIQKRRDMFFNSSLFSSPAVTLSGSKCIPHLGQSPGWF